MLKRFLSYCVLMFCVLQGFAQREASHWYFGNGASLDFSKGYPQTDNNSQLYTNEGCASVSDNAGRLLFYSEGVSVWNKSHTIMANGANLNGANSSTQSCIILKKPGTDDIYYLFTIDELGGPKGLCYSIIDMKQNNGEGAVVLKNQLLLTPTSEKLTAIRNADGKGWWVLTHKWNSDAFYSYQFDANGISNVVISKTGIIHKDAGNGKSSSAIGYLKSSPNAKRLASAICYVPNNNIELFDFNNSTGKVSDAVNLPSPGNAYGVCFSPDNSKLYVSYESLGRGVVQYDLTSRNIAASAVRVSPMDSTRYGALQLGPDDKIYIAKLGQYLDCITNPNGSAGNCGFKINYVNLKGMYSTFGLPDFFILNYNRLKVNLGNDTVVCDKSIVLDAKNPGVKYKWSTGQADQKITVERTGTYWVAISQNGQTAGDSIRIKFRKPIKLELGKDTIVCGDMYPLDGGNSGLNYRWSSGASTQVYVATKTGYYSVTVTDGICVKSDSIKVIFPSTGTPFIPLKEFKPDNGLVNNSFDYVLNGVTWFNLKVMNKRGKVVFETEDRKKKWNGFFDGKKAGEGIYPWEIKYKTACSHDKIMEQKGSVAIY
jgi:hypothetical protein